MKRLAVVLLYSVAAGAFAVSFRTPPAWLGVGLALVSLLARRPMDRDLVALRRILYTALAVTLPFGWLVREVPVVDAATMDAWTLGLGYAIAGLGGAFLFSSRAPERGAIPAAAGVLTIASFDLDAAIHPFLVAAGLAATLYLLADVTPSSWKRDPTPRLAVLGAFSVAALCVGTGIVFFLPLAQQKVEDAMVAIYTPGPDGIQSQFRSRLGELRNLKLSKKVVMRVWSQRPQRLRSRVLVSFDGSGWSRDPAAIRIREPSEFRVRDAEVSTFLDQLPGVDFSLREDAPAEQRWIRTRIVRVDGEGLVTPGGSAVVRAALDYVQVDNADVVFLPPHTRLRTYGVLHAMNHQRAQEGPISDAVRETTTRLPEILDPRLVALSNRLAEGAASPQAVAERIVAHLSENYTYSLDIGVIDSRDPVAEFLFVRREGWCEFFATSAALLMRVQGIPTRYVRGFNVIGSQMMGDHYVVRDWDRHAWVEAYIEGKGWLEYDPTPAAEYESLHANLGDDALSNAIEWLRGRLASLYAGLRSLEPMDVVKPALWLVGLFVLGRLGVDLAHSLRSRRRGRKRRGMGDETSELDALIESLDRELERLGCPRPKSRAPLEHWMRLPESLPLPETLRARGVRLIGCYYAARFGGSAISSDDVAGFRRLAEAIASTPRSHS